MRQTVAPPEPTAGQFADLLESLARRADALNEESELSPKRSSSSPRQANGIRPLKPVDRFQHKTRDSDSLGAILSYEQALRKHARYRPSSNLIDPEVITNLPEPALETSPRPTPVSPQISARTTGVRKSKPAQASKVRHIKNRSSKDAQTESPRAAKGNARALGKVVNRRIQQDLCVVPRTTAVSVRLNDAESVQLRSRAAESNMSVSAYMRSCVLEADHLRAQVKQALNEMRAQSLQPASKQPMSQTKLTKYTLAFGLFYKIRALISGEQFLLKRSV